MLEFTGLSLSSNHVHADRFYCRANVNAHTHIMPAYVLSYQTHNCPLWTLPTVTAQLTVLSVPPVLPWSFPECVQTDASKFMKHRKDDVQYHYCHCRVSHHFTVAWCTYLAWILLYVQLVVTHLNTKQPYCDEWETEPVSPVPLIKVALGEAAGRRAAGEGNPVCPGQPPDKL